MKVVICGSIKFTYEIAELKSQLEKSSHEVTIPWGCQQILKGNVDYKDFMAMKEKKGDTSLRSSAEEDLLKRYYKLIEKSDVLLIANYDKGDVKNYIGGNTLIEMAFAHILNKKIYLLNPIPVIGYSDEIKAMNPLIIDGDLTRVKG